MKNFVLSLFSTLLILSLTAASAASSLVNVTLESRAANTCADPTLADVFVAAFSPSRTAHVIRARWVFVATDTVGSGTSGDWQIQGPLFLAWQTPQEFTIPLYQLASTTSQTDFVFVPSTDGSVPVVSRFQSSGIIGYIYSTQVCGSVPLLVAAQTSATDHWYTTSAREHSMLIADGWTDAGTAGFVLPLNSCGSC